MSKFTQVAYAFCFILNLVPQVYAHKIIGLSGGVGWLDFDANQNLTINRNVFNQNIINTYTVNGNFHPNNMLAIHGGYLFHVPHKNIKWTIELLAFYNTGSKVTGQVYEGGIPLFNNFDNKYKISSKGLMLEGKLISDNKKLFVKPFVLFGIGTSWNKAYSYLEEPNIVGAVNLRGQFQSKTTSQLAYEFGFGFNKTINENIFSIEFKRQQLGTAKFGLYPTQTINEPLKVTAAFNQVVFSYSKILD